MRGGKMRKSLLKKSEVTISKNTKLQTLTWCSQAQLKETTNSTIFYSNLRCLIKFIFKS